MNYPFIRNIVNDYYNDHTLSKTKIWNNKETAINELNSEIIGLIENLKLEDEGIYFFIHEHLDSRDQQKLIYSLLHEYLNEEYEMYPNMKLNLEDYSSIEEFLLEEQQYLQEGIMFGLGVLAPIVALIVFYKKISRAGWNIMTQFNATNKLVSKKINEMTRSGKVKRLVLQNNVDECFKKCGVKPHEIHSLAGMAINKKSQIIPRQAEKQADCLTKCYLTWSLDQVQLVAKGYVDCLHASGERGNDLNDITAMLQHPNTRVCNEYFDVLKRHYEDFKDVLDVVFEPGPKKNEWILKYKDLLNNVLRTGRINHNWRKDHVRD